MRRTSVWAFIAGCGLAASVSAAEPLRDLDVHGTTLRAACRSDAWREATAALHRAASGHDPAVLTSLVRALLCGQGKADAHLVQRAAPARVVQVSEGTGQTRQRVRVAAADALLPLEGAAWEPQVRAEANEVHVAWHANEACVRGLRLRHRPATGWRIVELSEACD